MHDAHADSRSVLLDGPWWLVGLLVVVVTVLTFGSAPWKWVVLPVAVLFLWVPRGARWWSAVRRSMTAFRDGLRS